MLLFCEENHRITSQVWNEKQRIPENVVWIDLLNPTREEELAVEKFFGMSVPTREEMNEIEVSNRLYDDHGMLFMTATMLTKVDSGAPETHAVTFIVSEQRLVTVRYVDTTSFRRFISHITKPNHKQLCGATIFIALLEAIINRQADILERMDHEIERITRSIFRRRTAEEATPASNHQNVLEEIGRSGDIIAKIHESLVTFNRVVVFAGHHAPFIGGEREAQLTTTRRDITGLSDHGTHLAARANFLLDATLGMISIEQNGTIKIFSVASVVFLPPTLIASIYGMNFKLMPELDWSLGYPIALLLMLCSAIFPYAYFKRRKWL